MDAPGLRFVGKMGARVYFYLNGVYTSRAYFKPSQPMTPAQIAHREKWKLAIAEWHTLTFNEKKSWEAIGAMKAWTGYDAFIHAYFKR